MWHVHEQFARGVHEQRSTNKVTVFFTSLNLLYYTYEKYWFDEFLPEIRNCTSYAGVCRAYLIVHLKCTRKSSKMLCEGISSRSLLPAIPNHNLFFHTSFFLPYRSSVSFFRSVTLSLVNSCAHCLDVEKIQPLPHQTYQWILSCACLDGIFWTLLGMLLSLLLLLLLLLAQVFSMSRI